VSLEVLRRVPKPKLADLLGWTYESWDSGSGELTISFDGRDDFTNPLGYVQGGILAAMMDDTMGPSMVIAAGGERFFPTIDLHTHFLRPVKPGRISVTARPTQIGRSVAFAEARLHDARGRLCARATCSSASLPLNAESEDAPPNAKEAAE